MEEALRPSLDALLRSGGSHLLYILYHLADVSTVHCLGTYATSVYESCAFAIRSGLFEVDEEGREPCEDGSQPNIREGDIARAVEADKPDRQAEM